MKFTVEECLKLPVLQGARVVAGRNSLVNEVLNVSALDMYAPEDIRRHYRERGQMILTSFSAVRSDEDAQCRAIEELAAGGNAGVMVFHVGDIVKYLSDKVIAAAENARIPLIALEGADAPSMGEVIEALSRRIFYGRDDGFKSPLVNNTIRHILNFEKYGSFQAAAKAAALTNDFQMVLFSEDYNPVFSVETRHRTTIQEAVRHGKERTPGENGKDVYTRVDVNGVLTYWGPVRIKKTDYFLLIVDNEDSYSPAEITKLAETIELAMSMWGYTPKRDVIAQFIHALRRGNMSLAYNLRKERRLEPEAFIGVFYVRDGQEGKSLSVMDDLGEDSPLEILRIHEEDESFGIILETSGEIGCPREEIGKACNVLFRKLKEDRTVRVFHVMGISGMEGAADGYRLIKETAPGVEIIFPHKRVFTKYELILGENCMNIQREGGTLRKNYNDLLEPFRQEEESKEKQLLKTLETFVLDGAANNILAGKLLGVHSNTVQYRLKKVNDILGTEITAHRVMSSLTTALALKRLEEATV